MGVHEFQFQTERDRPPAVWAHRNRELRRGGKSPHRYRDLGGPSRSRRCLESAVDAISSLERDGGNRRTGTGMDFLVRKRLGLCAIRPSRSSWSGLLASLKTLVILNVGRLAVAMSQVEVIGVRKSFPTRNLSGRGHDVFIARAWATRDRGQACRTEARKPPICSMCKGSWPTFRPIRKSLPELHDPR